MQAVSLQICPENTLGKVGFEIEIFFNFIKKFQLPPPIRHVKFHDKSNINIKKGYYTCEYCQYYSTNTGKLKQHEALHTQEWEELIEKVAADEFEEIDIDDNE